MELVIFSPTEDGFVKSIEWNHEAIKQEVAQKVEYYKNLVYTDNQIKEAKADRATLKKFVQALEDERKKVKKQCLAPYDRFEKQIKEIIAIVNEPIGMIDGQVKDYEEQKKAEKLEKIKEFFATRNFPDGITLERIFDSRWLNASVTMKSVQEAITAREAQIKADIETLSNLPEFAFEATHTYLSTLDMNQAISEGHRLSEIQKKKAEYEAEQARKKAEAEQNNVKPGLNNMAVSDEVLESQNVSDTPPVQETTSVESNSERQWINFSANLTVDDALALKEFFLSRNIEFKAI